MKIYDCEQGTEEWYSIRCGVPTASCFDKIITTKGEPSKQRQKYLYQLAGEFITGAKEECYQSQAMQRGTEMEEEARNLYKVIRDVSVDKVGFIIGNPDFEYGCSPDGLIGDSGIIEIKCPNLATHVQYLIDGHLPTEYFQQTQGQLLVTKREWVDFVSYYPGIKPFICRNWRVGPFIESLRQELERFCIELKETIKKIGD